MTSRLSVSPPSYPSALRSPVSHRHGVPSSKVPMELDDIEDDPEPGEGDDGHNVDDGEHSRHTPLPGGDLSLDFKLGHLLPDNL